jgi:hypothetical protein
MCAVDDLPLQRASGVKVRDVVDLLFGTVADRVVEVPRPRRRRRNVIEDPESGTSRFLEFVARVVVGLGLLCGGRIRGYQKCQRDNTEGRA